MNEMKKASWGMEEKLSFLEWSKRGMNGVSEWVGSAPKRQQIKSIFSFHEMEEKNWFCFAWFHSIQSNSNQNQK